MGATFVCVPGPSRINVNVNVSVTVTLNVSTQGVCKHPGGVSFHFGHGLIGHVCLDFKFYF